MTEQNTNKLQELEEENKYLKEAIRQREAFIRNTFGTYLTNEVLEELLAEKKGLHIGGERRVVTILFSDIRQSTELSEKMDAVSFIRMLNHYLEEMIEIVNRMMGTAATSLQDFAKETLLPMISNYMTQIASGVISVVIGIKDCLLGLIIAIYVMLYQKRLLIASKKVIATFCKPQTANRIFTLTRKILTHCL